MYQGGAWSMFAVIIQPADRAAVNQLVEMLKSYV